MNPVVDYFCDARCWLIWNANKVPCDRYGNPLHNWQHAGATYAQASRFVDHTRVRGVGIRVNAARGLVALDLDDCLSEREGVIDDVALSLVLKWRTYTEITPSGRGLRAYALLTGEHKPVSVKRERGFNRELYFDTARFVIVTCNAYAPLPTEPPSANLATITPAQLDDARAMIERGRVYSADEELAQLRELHAITRDVETAQALRELVAAREAERVAQQVRSFTPAAANTGGGGLVALREHVAAQREGNRNSALFWAACRAAERGMHVQEINELLGDAARSTGLRDREIVATIRSAARSVTQ